MTPDNTARAYPQLNEGQQVALSEMLRSHDFIHGLEGLGGHGEKRVAQGVDGCVTRRGLCGTWPRTHREGYRKSH